ncbi:MAG: flagellar FliJ family protein [Deferrisomatales bacterium]|nr:flagellar FliJ family protein [Deferrisomatales bacterium]
MGFAFRLERVLAVRRIEEDGARQRHAEAQEVLGNACAARDDALRRLGATLAGLDGLKRRDELSEQTLYLHSLHLAGLRREIDVARARVAAATRDVERTAAELLCAHQARESLEKLREREESSWRRGQATREAREIDEIAVQRSHARKEENHGP